MVKDNSGHPSLIQVLIVDDEQLVRKGLRMTTDWEKHGMVVVDDAPNGSLGWQKFVQYRPQLVITDIVMPEMDGIELAQKIKEAAPDTAILFLSCHRDFKYARSGIQIGVHDYIVKTDMDDEHMDDALHRVRQQFERLASKRQTISVAVDSPFSQAHGEDVLGVWLHQDSYAAKQQLLQKLRMEWHWMLSKCYMMYIYFPKKAGAGNVPQLRNQWEHIIAACSGEIGYLQIDDQAAVVVCHQLALPLVQSSLVEMQLKNSGLAWRQSGVINSEADWFRHAEALYRLWEIEASVELLQDTHKEDIIRAIDYIDQHLQEDLRAADVAAEIGVSRSYFSTIFKEATGSSIISFISERKLEKAKELLSATSIRTEEVAEKVGIQDVKYFSKWFKKRAELTPGQYRIQTK
ncbi:two-component system response regulator YesN [Fontibacillus solani]|uniref:Two-component system response regulator YesN n=1 Tax=Fontibacillus solani TaxID=1572857 RepID=A0A7W3XQV1_9BACL|nr:response regulator [Fontibacillus solani]MBA9084888.1 two-component system response regulator YesN [Fontibacillus solani]